MIPPSLEASTAPRLCDALLGFVDGNQLDPLQQALRGFNHRFRNLLNGLRMGFYLAKRSGLEEASERWTEIDRTYAAIEQFQTRLQTIYQAMPLTPIVGRFGALVGERATTWTDWFRQNGNELVLETPDGESEGRFDPMFLGTALDNFVAWRAAALPRGGRATLRWTADPDGFSIDWTERAAERTAAPMTTPTTSHTPGPLSATTASLSLPLLARVIAEHGGRLSWTREPRVEARFCWPLAASARRTADAATSPP